MGMCVTGPAGCKGWETACATTRAQQFCEQAGIQPDKAFFRSLLTAARAGIKMEVYGVAGEVHRH